MGGKEGSRGYLYQAFASILEALCSKSDWDMIIIEVDSDKEKVDIALKLNNEFTKCIQVKSSINNFSKSNLSQWLIDLTRDSINAKEYEVVLIGQCDNNASEFINAIDKFKRNKMDKKSEKALNAFDTNCIKDVAIKFTRLPFDLECLKKIVISSLHEYVSHAQKSLTYEQISFIASATTYDQIISSTHGKGVLRTDFDNEIEKRINMIVEQYKSKRIPIGIKSFSRGAEKLEEETDKCLSLVDKFEERKLKEPFDWNNTIYNDLEVFLRCNTNKEQAYKIHLDTHSSIAFATGKILDNKTGINIFPVQKSAKEGTVIWEVIQANIEQYPKLCIDYEQYNDNYFDSALILNISRPIYDSVIDYIKECNLQVGKIINCNLSENNATSLSTIDGTHAFAMASSVYNALARRTTPERRAILHIFVAAPNGFTFFLGQNSNGFGKCILYEYDFGQKDTCSYIKSIDFTK